MYSVSKLLHDAFARAIRDAFGFDADPLVGLSQNPQFGDYQSNAAMGLAKVLAEKTGQKTNPRAVAQQILDKLTIGEMVAEPPAIAGPGFINVRLNPAWLGKQLAGASDEAAAIKVDQPQTVIVDYSGVNIAKAMHVGHYRGTIIGDAFARILAAQGHNVIRQNHVGDWGLQMGMVTFAMESAGDGELTLTDLETMYRRINKDSEDKTIKRQMAERTRALQQTPKDQLHAWQKVRAVTLAAAEVIYARLGVLLSPEDVRGESFYSDQYGPLVAELQQTGSAVETEGAIGIFPPGFKNREGEPRPFIIQSRDGSYQYPTFDLAALRFRVQTLHADRIIYTHDDRQAEHFAMLFATAKLLGWDQRTGRAVELDYAPFGTVLGEDNKPLKSRSGENVKLADLLDEAEARGYAIAKTKDADRVAKSAERGESASPLPDEQLKQIGRDIGIGAIKYADLSKDRTSDYVFNWDKMLAFEGNTAPYLQYVYARICSIFRRAGEWTPGAVKLDAPAELALAKHVLRLSDVIEQVGRELKPHLLCTYLYELAARFGGFYENCPVLSSEGETRISRLTMCKITANVMALGLDLLGIGHPEQM